MPELKNTFTGGKMEKDLDERILPSGQYREALNISVATSEDSDVGAAQNILGNIQVTQAIVAKTTTGIFPYLELNDEYKGSNYHVAQIVDPQTDMLYRFIHTASPTEGIWMDRVVEFDTQSSLDMHWHEKEKAVMVDIFKVEAKITEYDPICITPSGQAPIIGNKSRIKINKNINQLRWGMRIVINGIDDEITIEDIDYSTKTITLNKPIISPVLDPFPNPAPDIIFYGDRNLSFGDVLNGVSGIKKITGINIIDGMIFWTDNSSEPKKINIERSKDGCDSEKWSAVGVQYPQSDYPPGDGKINDFNQHTLLIINGANPEDCTIDDNICPIYGCTDVSACNFDPLATIDDGSCTGLLGCTDATACNYNVLATCDDGSCHHLFGCMNINACNYDDGALCDDGSCIVPDGCTDPLATNYDPAALCDDGSCIDVSWDCDANYDCIDPGTGAGAYTTLTACNAACIEPSWDCDGQGNCSDPGTGNGLYPSLAACNAACPDPSWDCISPGVCQDPGTGLGAHPTENDCLGDCPSLEWECISPGNCSNVGLGNGSYNTQNACQTACSATQSWDCGNGTCYDPGGGNGLYSSLLACQTACVPSWDCTTGICSDPGTGLGQYASSTACIAACTTASWDCDAVTGICSDPGTGNGFFGSLADCQSNCITPSWDCDGQGNCTNPGTGNGAHTTYNGCVDACPVPEDVWHCAWPIMIPYGSGPCVYGVIPAGSGLTGYPQDIVGGVDQGEILCNSLVCSHTQNYDCINNVCTGNINGNGVFFGPNGITDCTNSGCHLMTYDCNGTSCVNNYSGTGAFTTLNNCNNNCPPIFNASWDCDGGNCSDPGTGNGAYTTLNACQALCGVAMCAIPDIEFENVLIIGSWDSGSPDGQVPQANVSNVSGVTFSGAIPNFAGTISSLVGIECFHSLGFLDCSENQLTTLDLTSNDYLHSLSAQNNQLTSIYFSAWANICIPGSGSCNTASMILDNNQLTSLDFKQHPNLYLLSVRSNNLTSLNVKNGTNDTVANSSTHGYPPPYGSSATGLMIYAHNNPSLMEIIVDDPTWSQGAWPINVSGWNGGAQFCTAPGVNCLPAI